MGAKAYSLATLQISGLTVAYGQGGYWQDAVRDVSLSIAPGQTYGLVGESGSGKTTLAMAIMRYLGEQGSIRSGEILFEGRSLLPLSRSQMRGLWGGQIGLVPQNPLSSLNPSLKIGDQLAEGLRYQRRTSRAESYRLALHWLDRVHLPDAARVAGSYPHQISGGMQQRVMIALALSLEPRLLVLDEPTTSLDVTTQAAILDLVRELIAGRQAAVLYVTHNLGVVAQVCDRVGVLYAGELVEEAPVIELFERPRHPYTQGLLASVPQLGMNKHQGLLQGVPGQIPPLGARPSGCIYADRCPLAIEICQVRPPLYQPAPGRLSRCHRWEVLASGAGSAPLGEPGAAAPSQMRIDKQGEAEQAPVLRLEEVSVHYSIRRTLGQLLRGERRRRLRAVSSASLQIEPGHTLGLVGESGSGKTSLARAVTGLVPRSSGAMELLSLPLPASLSQRSLDTLRHLQMVFQNPEEALNPYLSVGASLRRPLVRLRKLPSHQVAAEIARLLASVRLPPEYAHRMPAQLSGGEKQRVAIARAFASQPELLVADEPVSSLDVSVQATILNLLNALQVAQNSSILFISHDLAVVGYLADVVAVIYLGHLMEVSRAQDLFTPPYHPYTETLLAAIPSLDPRARRQHVPLAGEIPSPLNVPSGCPFHTRCPRFLGDVCVKQMPPWREDPQTGKRYYCHIPVDELRQAQREEGGD